MVWLQFGLLGLGTGALYALTALGVNVVYRASGVVNFAAGAVGAVCALTFYDLRDDHGWSSPVALVVVLAMGVVINALIHQIVIERLRHVSAVMKLVATLGAFTLLQGIAQVGFGPGHLAVPLLPHAPVKIAKNLVVGEDRLILIGIGVGLAIVLMAVYRFTPFGLATSAVAENRRAASTLGWSARTIELTNWSLSGAISALAGVLLAPIVGLDTNTLVLLIIPALAAALIGGFVSFPLTIVGGLTIGVLESELSRYDADVPGLSRAVPFIVITLVVIAGGRARPTRADLPTRLPSVSRAIVKKSWVIVGVAVAAILIFTLGATWVDSITFTLLAMLLVFSIIVVTGYAGQISLAQYSLGGFGAWVAGRLVSSHGWPFWAALIAGVVATILAGLVVALPALRTRGVNLAIATIALGLVIQEMVLGNSDLTGGINGTDIGSPHLFGINLDSFSHPERYAVMVLVAVLLVGLLVANVRRGRAGLRMLTVRSNERAAASLGINTFGVKLYAFAVAAGIAGLAGVLTGFHNELIVFSDFTVFGSIQYVVFAFLGGVGWVAGAIYAGMFAPGALPSRIVDEFVNINDYISIIGGASIILVLLSNPDGIASANAFMVDQVRKLIKPRLAGVAARLPHRRDREPVVLPPRERNPAVLSIRDVTVQYGAFTALNAVSMDVRPGQITGLIGPNGAGKTTLLDAVTGFTRIKSGKVMWGDRDITRWSPTRRARGGLGRSWQAVELFEELTVRDNLRAATDRHGISSYLRDLVHPGTLPTTAMMQTVIDEFDLAEHLDTLPGSLPQGTRRLVGIARAMLTEPDILFLDEPAAGLDVHETQEFGHLLRRVANDYQVAVVLVEHDVPLVMETCDHVIVLNFGEKIAEDAPAAIRVNTDVIAAYLGEPDEEESGQLAAEIAQRVAELTPVGNERSGP